MNELVVEAVDALLDAPQRALPAPPSVGARGAWPVREARPFSKEEQAGRGRS